MSGVDEPITQSDGPPEPAGEQPHSDTADFEASRVQTDGDPPIPTTFAEPDDAAWNQAAADQLPAAEAFGAGSGAPPVEAGSATPWGALGRGWSLLVPVFVFVALIAAGFYLYTTLIFSWETAVARRQITLFSDRFRPVILHNNVYMNTPFALAEDRAFFVGSIDAGQPAQLVSLDLETGRLAWRQPAEEWQYPLAVPGLVYIEQPGATTAQIMARSSVTGEEVWTTNFRFFGGSSVDYLARIDDRLSVRLVGDWFGSYYLIDLETGRTVQQKRTDTEYVFLIDREPLRVYEAAPGSVRVTAREGWQTEVDGFDLRPFVAGNVILVQYRPYDAEHNALLALNRQSGDLLWQRDDPLVGNTAVYADTAFVLVDRQGGAQLLALDITSGEMVGSVLFTSPDDAAQFPFFVAATAETVGVYFGDGRQLFIFDWLPPQE